MKFSEFTEEEFNKTEVAVVLREFGAPKGQEDVIGSLPVMILVQGEGESAYPEIAIRVELSDEDLETLNETKVLYFVILGDTIYPMRVQHQVDGGIN